MMKKACAGHFIYMISFEVHKKVLRNGYPHFTDEDIEPKRVIKEPHKVTAVHDVFRVCAQVSLARTPYF